MKSPKLYTKLASWWPLLSKPQDYEQEAGVFTTILKNHPKPVKTVLELGSGGGNNAMFMKKHFEMTLTDLSKDMLAVSKKLNPKCGHVQGDMRSINLNRQFDAVFVHDAIAYITTEKDLKKVFGTTIAHIKDGGISLFAPDWTKETFKPYTDHGGHDNKEKSLRYLEWVYDPDPNDTTYTVEFAILLKNGKKVTVEHDRHTDGLFPKSTWLNLLKQAGFQNVNAIQDPHEKQRTLFTAVK